MRRSVLVMVAVLALVGGSTPWAAATARDATDTCAAAPASTFGDVDESNVHRRAIDCIRHHGITAGKTAETYDRPSRCAGTRWPRS